MNASQIERKHGGHGAAFEIDGQRYYVPTCCIRAEVEITDEDTRRCVTHCPNHGQTPRQYAPSLTAEQRAAYDAQVNGFDGFNPRSDPYGNRSQRDRKSGYTTHRWHTVRGL